MNERITITTPDGKFDAHVARPDGVASAPVVIVIQEIFGVNADVRAHCAAFAAKGYIAIAPDLFWRLEAGVDLTDGSAEEWARARGFYQRFNDDLGVADIAATMAVARTLPGASGKVGVVGFCLGGLMAYLTAARSAPDAAVSYYGGRSQDYASEMAGMTTPWIMHLAEEDAYIPKPAQQTIIDAAAARPNATVYVYPGQDHAFARVNGKTFNAGAAALAEQRSDALFNQYLR
jgi:carboxymethylenebutenolidase